MYDVVWSGRKIFLKAEMSSPKRKLVNAWERSLLYYRNVFWYFQIKTSETKIKSSPTRDKISPFFTHQVQNEQVPCCPGLRVEEKDPADADVGDGTGDHDGTEWKELQYIRNRKSLALISPSSLIDATG